MTSTAPTSDATLSRRRRRPRSGSSRRPPGFFGSIPWSIRIGAIAIPLVLGIKPLSSYWASRQLSFTVARLDGPVQSLSITAYSAADRPWSPSPPDVLGTVELSGPGPHHLPPSLVAQEAVLRIEAADCGASYLHVGRGEGTGSVQLAAPTVLERVVIDAEGQPVAGARVLALGGGSRGIPLGEAVTDGEGRFVIDTISETEGWVMVRVLAAGYRMLESDTRLRLRGSEDPDPDEPFVLRKADPIRGRVVVAPWLDDDVEVPDDLLAGRTILVRSVPGVTATTADDGTFVIDHMKPVHRPPLLVHDLPENWTHRSVSARAGDVDVEIVLEPAVTVRGMVLNGNNGRGIPGVQVWHSHGPHGDEPVSTSAGGWFERVGSFTLERVPIGSVEVKAAIRVPRRSAVEVLGSVTLPEAVDHNRSRFVNVSQQVEFEVARDRSSKDPLIIRLH